MDILMAGLTLPAFAAALAVTLFAGFVKGAVGFAMPMIMISAFSAFLPPDLALIGLILPTLFTNLTQAFRQGFAAAWQTAKTYHRFLIGTVVFIAISAQFADAIPQVVFLLILGVPITLFALLQLSGRSMALHLDHRARAEWGLGVIGGLYGGISGIWGPPLLVYLLSTGVEKIETIRVQGVVFLIGSVALLSAHLQTGLADAQGLGFSAALVVPAFVGQQLGMQIGDRLNQQRFRRWTQVLLVITGANLIRQAFSL